MIYLDHNATTPVDPRVFEAMRPYFLERFGNAASRHHAAGRRAAEAVARARQQVAAALRADPREIVWTSGATESNNLALKGVAAARAHAGRRHIVTVLTEHAAVLDPCRVLEAGGCEVTRLAVDGQGRLDLDALRAALRDDTLLVSAMAANNETGVIHPVAEIGRLCRERGVLFHTDAAQAFAKEAIDVDAACIDLLSFSGHKVYGPKGAGGLYLRRRRPRVRCEALLHGGGHQGGVRSGTLDVPGIVGLGEAAEIAVRERKDERARLAVLRDRLQRGLIERLDGVAVNGGESPRLPGTLNVSFADVDAESLIRRLPGLAVSSASACTTAAMQPSHVLGAMGLEDERVLGSVRLSAGRFTTEDEIDRALAALVAAVSEERADPGGGPACEA